MFADELIGDSSNNTFIGGAGNDRLFGRFGDDTLVGEDGDDYLEATTAMTCSSADTVSMQFMARTAMTCSRAALAMTSLLAGENDILDGGAGADLLDGGLGFDYASYRTALGSVYIDMLYPTTNTGDAGGDILSAIEGLIGSAFADERIAEQQRHLCRCRP